MCVCICIRIFLYIFGYLFILICLYLTIYTSVSVGVGRRACKAAGSAAYMRQDESSSVHRQREIFKPSASLPSGPQSHRPRTPVQE